MLLLAFSCNTKKPYIAKIEGKQIGITKDIPQNVAVESYIRPYRENINRDMDEVLAFAPETLDKSKGEWQTGLGSLQADITLKAASKILMAREKKKADICILNHGGIRSIIAKGNVTARTAFELMPFENSLVVAALKGGQVIEMAEYIIKEKKPHPLSGMEIILDRGQKTYKAISVQGKPVDPDATYYVATNDYLCNGGDNMNFFKKRTAFFDLDYKLRNIWIDYFKEADTVSAPLNQRIIVQ